MKKQNQNNPDVSEESTFDKGKTDKLSEEEFDYMQFIEELMAEEPIEKEIVINNDEEIFDNLNKSLGRQVLTEMEIQSKMDQKGGKKGKPSKMKYTLAGVGTLLFIFVFLFLTPLGRNFLWQTAANYAYGKMNYDDGLNVVAQEVVDDVEEDSTELPVKPTETPVQWDTNTTDESARIEEGITNILLLGEEAIDSGNGRGRTDIMMIATMNTIDKSFKLTSLMRDMLVQIPDNKDNKLNAAYEIGGIPLLYKTIELNFDVKLDGYVLVGFDDFENVINKLGGVKITLTDEEANYLNTTNYISKPEFRNVVGGSQVLNGNQALGYCRVRYVATGDDQINDFGRTSRQRIVLNAIFDQYKSKSMPELVLLMNDILPLITTDIKQDDFETYLRTAMSLGLTEIQNLRLPADHTFDEGYVRKMSVLIPDLQENVKILHEFIFGKKYISNK
ncbi:LCP family protein [Anaerocolumna sp. MB42-C2]|uniref:LCP family protein n=1 Tax=Anaerocolumna sp. MB42-C2 TaxID=3070997 RepID=UPI0027DFBC28|nr:LCP family protein [Anaerocolumna sp. MB42-C2]WMJ88404.1 LCP family protein [Anaerocolumna sp. MB42-C2]